MGNSVSAPSSSTTTSPEKYDVFISFRGEDTRNNFTSHLHAALCRKQIHTFIDDGLEKGDDIWLNLSKSIRKSKISVVIFSKDYASSKWCLRELVAIMECKEKKGQTVIPVFYQVDPSHVRKQKESFEDSFVEHEKQVQEEVPKWRKALTEASNLSGWDSSVTKPEAKLVEEIVKVIEKKLTSREKWPPSDPKKFIGLEERIEPIMSLLSFHRTDDIRIIGIWGMGGLGKTTIAYEIYKKVSDQFEGKCFIRDVRGKLEQSGGPGGSVSLQEEFLSQVLPDQSHRKLDGINFSENIKKRFSKMKVFIVLDDVYDFNKLETLVGELDQFGFGSRIMITSRDKQVLINCTANVDNIYKVEGLNDSEALKLFCKYAFKKDHPVDDLKLLSTEIVCYAKGNPLALKVLGSSLFGKNKVKWESAKANLQENLKGQVFDVLNISYDGLDNEEKNMFLGIACFFKGDYKMDVRGIYGDSTNSLLDILEEKSLITVLESGQIDMHDLLQDVGKEIDCRESKSYWAGNGSRLWRQEDILHTLKNGDGTEKVRGIVLCLDIMDEDINLSPRTFENMKGLRFLKFWMRYYSGYGSQYKVNCQDGLTYLSNELRSLIWFRCPLKGLPSNFIPNYNLIELDLRNSNLETLMEDIMVVPKLKWLILKGCRHLIRISKRLHAPSLVTIDLGQCKELLDFPTPDESSLKQLRELDLMWCEKLKHLPSKIHFESLVNLRLNFSNLETFQEDIMFVPKLKNLILERCQNLTCISKRLHAPLLEKIDLRDCEELLDFPSPDEYSLKQLRELIIWGCKKLKQLPRIYFESLVSLRLSCSNLETLQEDTLFIPKLKRLILKDCRHLTSISKHLHAPLLEKIDIQNCEELLNFPTPDEQSLKQPCEFIIQGCKKLKQFSHIHLESLTSLRLSYINIETIQEDTLIIPKLKSLILKGCQHLTSISKHLHAPSLEKIDLTDCIELLSFPSPDEHSLKQLREFIIRGCKKLKQLPSIHFESLVSLSASHSNLETLQEDTLFIPKLKSLILEGCRHLTSISKHLHAPLLESINLQNCEKLLDFPSPDEYSLKQLRELNLQYCKKLKQLPSIHFESLVSLSANYSNLETLQEDTLFIPKLKRFILVGCQRLTSISKHLHAPLLETIYLRNCEELLDFPSPDEYSLKQLRELKLYNCKKLKQLSSIHCEYLRALNASYSNLETHQKDTLFIPKLKSLILEGCRHLTSISKHLHAPLLESINLQNCEELLDFPSPDEYSLKQLRESKLQFCFKQVLIKQLPSKIHWESLRALNLDGCIKLTSIPNLSNAPLLDKAKFIFTNCLNLEETMVINILKRAIEGYMQKDFIQEKKEILSFQNKEEKRKYLSRTEITIFCPGGKVPQLFNHQSKKSWIQVQMKWPDFEKGDLVGFAVCVVIEFQEYCGAQLEVFYGCMSNDGEENSPSNYIMDAFEDGIYILEGSITVFLGTSIDSDHVALSLLGWPAAKEYTNILFKFWLSEKSCLCRVKSCGVYPIY